MKWFVCIKCGVEKPKDDFYKDKSKKSGVKPRCKPCDALSQDKDRRREYEAEYRQKNSARRAEIVRKSMAKNAEHHKEKRKRYLSSPSGRERHRTHGQTRYAREKAAFVERVDVYELLRSSQGRCAYCGADVAGRFHVDHFIPISKGGKHERSNLRISCPSCNLRKGAKLPEELSYQMV